MSIRRTDDLVSTKLHPLTAELDAFREAQRNANTGAPVIGSSLDSLTETERSAATIGAHPDDLKPIGFMNDAHYVSLLKGNALDGRLTQKIEAYKAVQRAA